MHPRGARIRLSMLEDVHLCTEGGCGHLRLQFNAMTGCEKRDRGADECVCMHKCARGGWVGGLVGGRLFIIVHFSTRSPGLATSNKGRLLFWPGGNRRTESFADNHSPCISFACSCAMAHATTAVAA